MTLKKNTLFVFPTATLVVAAAAWAAGSLKPKPEVEPGPATATVESASSSQGPMLAPNPWGLTPKDTAPSVGEGASIPTRGGEELITCSANKDIVVGSVACALDGITTENQFGRCFDGTNFPAAATVLRLDFGIEIAEQVATPIEVIGTLYSIDACDPILPDGDLTILGSGSITLAGDGSENGTIQTISFGAGIIVPAGTNVVAEIAYGADNRVWPGSNPNGQTCLSYIAADDCGLSDLTDLANIGFPDMHLVLNLILGEPTECGDGTCEAAEDCCGCEEDCGACSCGDGTCHEPCEDCNTCEADCGECPTCGNPEAGDCCDPEGTGSPGCEDFVCCEAVCAIDPFCCATVWDHFCADEAESLCPLCNPPPEGVVTCSANKNIVVGSVACAAGGITTDNQFARCFDAANFPESIAVLSLDFGVEIAEQLAAPIEVIGTLYSIAVCDDVLEDANLTVLGSGSITLAGDASENGTIQTVSFGAGIVVPAGTNVVAEISYLDGNAVWPGSNSNGQTCPSYIGSDSCGLPDLSDLAGIGFPNMHLVLNLNLGEITVCGDGSCQAAENCCGCEADCGTCSCGDGTCTAPCEDCDTCEDDCGACPVCDDAEGDCCEAAGNGSIGCEDSVCCEAVCAVDEFCCAGEWDNVCAAFAALNCQVCRSIATGSDSSVDGYLLVTPDEYGSWSTTTFGGEGDLFNPGGSLGPMEAAFTSGVFCFVADDDQRELLSDIVDWQNIFGADSSLSRQVTSPSVSSDTNEDGVPDTLVSAFRVFGGSTDLAFDLTQHVFALPGRGDTAVSVLQQDYRISNNGNSIDFALVTTFDGDFTWVGDFDDDSVGTLTNGMPDVDRFVSEQEAGLPETAVTVSSAQSAFYYGAKLGIDPSECGGGGVPYGFGTDVQIWDAFGVPDGTRECQNEPDSSDWRNHVGGVGYDTDGESGAAPTGCGTPCDASMGLEIPISLSGKEVTTITILHTYGSNVPPSTQQIPAILSSDPPDGAIDAGQPDSLDDKCATPAGWDAIDIGFDIDAANVVAEDFMITVDPADVTPPSISDLSTDGNTVSLTLDGIIPTAHWTMFTHQPSGTSTRLGYLPADVNSSKQSNSADVLDIIDFLNDVGDPLEMWQCDCNRSGACNSADILCVIDLLNGADCFDVWNGVSLP